MQEQLARTSAQLQAVRGEIAKREAKAKAQPKAQKKA
jgi:hypothetical protein